MALDIMKEINGLLDYKKTFILSPAQWKKIDIPKVEWKNVKFSTANKIHIPRTRGIYIFIIRHDSNLLPSHGYIAYVGLTGDKNERTLYQRYGDYLRDQVRPKRINIYNLLNRWKDDIYFYFAEIPDRKISLSKIETNLLDSIIPPYNRKDFTGEFGKVVREAFEQ